MKEFTGKDLKILDSLSSNRYENSYYREKIWCPTCKQKKPRRDFLTWKYDNTAETVKHICNKCRIKPSHKDHGNSRINESVKHTDTADNGSDYIKWLEESTDGLSIGTGDRSSLHTIHNDHGASHGLG